MDIAGTLSKLNEILRTYHLIEEKLKTLEADIKKLSDEFKEVRIEHVKLESRIAHLEEARETLKAEMRAIVAEGNQKSSKELSDALMQSSKEYNEAISKLSREFQEAKSKMEVDFIRAMADMYKKNLDAQAITRSSALELPQSVRDSIEDR